MKITKWLLLVRSMLNMDISSTLIYNHHIFDNPETEVFIPEPLQIHDNFGRV
jgi:hypothetical protein